MMDRPVYSRFPFKVGASKSEDIYHKIIITLDLCSGVVLCGEATGGFLPIGFPVVGLFLGGNGGVR